MQRQARAPRDPQGAQTFFPRLIATPGLLQTSKQTGIGLVLPSGASLAIVQEAVPKAV